MPGGRHFHKIGPIHIKIDGMGKHPIVTKPTILIVPLLKLPQMTVLQLGNIQTALLPRRKQRPIIAIVLGMNLFLSYPRKCYISV
jgi:hypothetical protein